MVTESVLIGNSSCSSAVAALPCGSRLMTEGSHDPPAIETPSLTWKRNGESFTPDSDSEVSLDIVDTHA